LPRLFIAVSLPDRVTGEVEGLIATLRDSLPRSSWTRASQAHITLAFLGEHSEAVAGPLAANMEKRIGSLRPFEARLSGGGVFPDLKRVRVGWLGIEPEGPLEAIAAAVREATRETEVSFDSKPFAPHLTIVRMKDRWPSPAVRSFVEAMSGFHSAWFPVATVTIFSSLLPFGGAVHTPLRQIALGTGSS